VSAPPDGSERLRRALREGQAALGARLSRLREASERDVHQCRVECRRMRALLKSFGPFFSGEQASRFREALGRVADLHAEIRGLDVMAALPPLRNGSCARELGAARQQAVRRLVRRAASPGNRGAVELCAGGPRRGSLGLRAGVTNAEVLRRVRRSWRRVQHLLESRPHTRTELHRLRIRLKNCRYVLEIVPDISPQSAAALRRRLRDAQQNLGEQRDAEAAVDWLKADPERAARGRVALKSLERRVKKLRRDLDPLLARLARDGARWDHAVTQLLEHGVRDPS
jgi:CHAD domain-containing protein